MDTLVQLAGILCLVAAAATVHVALGLVVLGVALLVIGYRLEVAKGRER
jgi:hypothetical protein